MDITKVIIVEDEVIIANSIINDIINFGYQPLELAVTYSEAIDLIEKEKPDIGIFDIQLSGQKSGIDLAHIVNEKYNFPFLFLTSNSDKATLMEAKLTKPSGFLVKPFNSAELFAAIEIAIYNWQNAIEPNNNTKLLPDSLFIKQKKGHERVLFSNILYIKSDNVYLDIFLVDGSKKVVRGPLKNYIPLLPTFFVRCHRSYIINIKYLKAVNNLDVLVNSKSLPISKGMREYILNRLLHD